jgi:DNA-directed RNA polymerase I and III subunit RPAC2
VTQQRETDFCGYSVPHPYEPKLNIRIQSHDIPAIEVLRNSLKCMEEMSILMEQSFENALDRYRIEKSDNN